MKKKIFYWSPCLNPVGTVISTINSAKALSKYNKNFEVFIVNSCGEWDRYMKDFSEMNEVWDLWIGDGNAPARACGESKLATPEYKVEVIAELVSEDGTVVSSPITTDIAVRPALPATVLRRRPPPDRRRGPAALDDGGWQNHSALNLYPDCRGNRPDCRAQRLGAT